MAIVVTSLASGAGNTDVPVDTIDLSWAALPANDIILLYYGGTAVLTTSGYTNIHASSHGTLCWLRSTGSETAADFTFGTGFFNSGWSEAFKLTGCKTTGDPFEGYNTSTITYPQPDYADSPRSDLKTFSGVVTTYNNTVLFWIAIPNPSTVVGDPFSEGINWSNAWDGEADPNYYTEIGGGVADWDYGLIWGAYTTDWDGHATGGWGLRTTAGAAIDFNLVLDGPNNLCTPYTNSNIVIKLAFIDAGETQQSQPQSSKLLVESIGPNGPFIVVEVSANGMFLSIP